MSSESSFDDSDGYSSAEDFESAAVRRRTGRVERDFDELEDDPDDSRDPEGQLRAWLEERGESALLSGALFQLRKAGVGEDEWVAELEGMERDGTLAGFLGAIEAQGSDAPVGSGDEEDPAPNEQQGRLFRMSTLFVDSDEEPEPEPEVQPARNGHRKPDEPINVVNPLRVLDSNGGGGGGAGAGGGGRTSAGAAARQGKRGRRRRGALAVGTKGYNTDVDRSQQAIKRVNGLLECELSESLVTLGILLIILIHEGQQIKKGAESKFGESLKFRCTYALEQHTRPIKQGWLRKQGEMGESFKQRWFVLLPDVWTYGRNSSEYGRLILFYKSEPKTVEERLAPKGAVMLHQMQYRVTLIERDGEGEDEMRLEITIDADGFIDAGEMRYNYVFGAADVPDDSHLSRTSSAPSPSALRNSRYSSAGKSLQGGFMTPEEDLADWARLLSDQSMPAAEELERMMPENPQERVVSETCATLKCDRASIFLLDDRNDELVLHVGKGADAREIRIPRTAGIAGECLRMNQTLLINDPYNDSRFNQATDKKTGYRTTSILAVPITTNAGQTIGVLQAINKLPPATGFNSVDQRAAVQLAAGEQLSRASAYQAKAHADLEGKSWRARQKSGFHAGKFSRFNVSTTKKFAFFSIVVAVVQMFAAMKLLANAGA
jgi:hypothetical protein